MGGLWQEGFLDYYVSDCVTKAKCALLELALRLEETEGKGTVGTSLFRKVVRVQKSCWVLALMLMIR